jgi:hypothetical protein
MTSIPDIHRGGNGVGYPNGRSVEWAQFRLRLIEGIDAKSCPVRYSARIHRVWPGQAGETNHNPMRYYWQIKSGLNSY